MKSPRNQRRRNRRLNVLLTAACLVLAVLMGAFLVLRCLSFDENGAHVIDRYGVIEQEGDAAGLVDYSRYSKGNDANSDSEEEEKTSAKTEEQPTASTASAPAIRAITVSAKDLTYDDDCRNQVLSLKSAGVIDTVIVDLKTSDGYLTEQIETTAFDVSTVQTVYSDEFPTAVAELKQAGIRVIGRVHAFMDNMATRQNTDLSCWYGAEGTNWLDVNNNRWLDPTDTTAVQYLCDIVRKGTEIGCDEILLSNFRFPQGATDLISFDGDASNYNAVIENDLQQILAAAGGTPVSLYVNEDSDTRAVTGQDIASLYRSLYRIFAAHEVAQADGTLLSLGDSVCEWYTDREAWSGTTTSAVYDSEGDLYQIFLLS